MINNQTDAEFWESLDHFSSETDIDEYISFDTKIVTSLPATDPLMADWRQETRNKSITEVTETSDASAEEANQSEEELEIKIDEDENRKITTAGRSIKEP